MDYEINDTDGDGMDDEVLVDVTGDGYADLEAYDDTGDGIPDYAKVDLNHDGLADAAAAALQQRRSRRHPGWKPGPRTGHTCQCLGPGQCSGRFPDRQPRNGSRY